MNVISTYDARNQCSKENNHTIMLIRSVEVSKRHIG